MSNVKPAVTYHGRSIGIIILTATQLLVGVLHVFFGLWLLVASSFADSAISAQSPLFYSVYTLVFGLLTLIFTVGIWLRKNWGWIGTFAVSMFVIVADALTLLNLPSIPGIPPSAAGVEIIYSILILLYLSQTHVRIKYHISY